MGNIQTEVPEAMNATLKRITATPKTQAIIENGEQREVTLEQLRKVRNMVYWCHACKAYHLWDGKSFEDIEVIIGK